MHKVKVTRKTSPARTRAATEWSKDQERLRQEKSSRADDQPPPAKKQRTDGKSDGKARASTSPRRADKGQGSCSGTVWRRKMVQGVLLRVPVLKTPLPPPQSSDKGQSQSGNQQIAPKSQDLPQPQVIRLIKIAIIRVRLVVLLVQPKSTETSSTSEPAATSAQDQTKTDSAVVTAADKPTGSAPAGQSIEKAADSAPAGQLAEKPTDTAQPDPSPLPPTDTAQPKSTAESAAVNPSKDPPKSTYV